MTDGDADYNDEDENDGMEYEEEEEEDENGDENDDIDSYYIKRIIGLPGEKVRIGDDGEIYINDVLLEENYGKEKIDFYNRGRAVTDVKLGENEYFVMGDNRNNSDDSRYGVVGNLNRDRLMGKAVFRMWPLNKMGKVK